MQRKLSLVFTGDEFADGGDTIINTLRKHNIKGSFFFTGRFYRNPSFKAIIKQLKKDGHYLGAHSDQHLLYCDWSRRDSLLVNRQQFKNDLLANYRGMEAFGIKKKDAPFFLPPYEWYNDTIAAWTKELGLQLINFTPGTLSTADYTTPDLKNYRSTETIYRSILNYERSRLSGLNGFLLLLHIGTDSKRTDKFYLQLDSLVQYLRDKGYSFQTVSEIIGSQPPN